MSIQNRLKSLLSNSTRRRPTRRRPPASRLRLEALEDRCLLAFLAPVTYAAGPSPLVADVVAADFNGDARLDLAVANYSQVGNSNVSVLLGNADGTFQPALTTATGAAGYQYSLAAGDFNADGKLDVATFNASGVSVLLGNGNGTFQAPRSVGSVGPQSVAVGDFNGDGNLDLAGTSNYWQGGGYGYYVSQATVLLGNGDGSFSGPLHTDLGYGYSDSKDVADFNGDGMSDLVLTDDSYGPVRVLAGDGLGNLQPLAGVSTGAGFPNSVVAGDVNGDGHIDLVTANQPNWYYSETNSTVSVLLGDGLGSFGSAQIYATGDGATSVVLGDFNRDGQVDLIAANDANISVLLGRGGGTFAPPLNFATGPYPKLLTAGDFNGDGWLDAATVHHGSNVSVLINDQSWPQADVPLITINDVEVTEGNTGSVSATFTVSLSESYDQPVNVHYETADDGAAAGSDYQAVSAALTFAPGVTSQTITVLVNGDRLAENYETFFIRLTDPTNAFVADATGVGAILNDEPYLGIVGYVNGLEGNTGTTPFIFTVTLSAPYDAPVTVNYATADGGATAGTDYQAASGTLTIPAGQTSGTITVLVISDRVPELQENFLVNLTGATSAHINNLYSYATIGDDEPRITMNNSVSLTEGNSGTKVMTFTVMLSAAYDQAVTFNFATADGTAKISDNDYVATSGTMTFAPGETTKTINVVIKGDTKKEADEYFYLQLSGASSNALFWSVYTNELISQANGRINILNDDLAPGKKR